MNRLQQAKSAVGKVTISTSPPPLDLDALLRSTRVPVSHALFAPLHYEPNYAYPLLVWLHGPDSDERQVQRILPLLSTRNYVAVGPRGNVELTGRRGFGWSDHPDCLGDADQAVCEVIDIACSRYHIATPKIFLAGLENGGRVAYRIAAQHPGKFAGVLSVGGAFPSPDSAPVRLIDLRSTPVFIGQGRQSEVYSEEQLCQDLRLLHSAGVSLTVRQYPCGDVLDDQMLRDMDTWMMEIVTGTLRHPLPPVIRTS